MWYVVPAVAGREESLCNWINDYLDKRTYTRCFVPKYEEVRRKHGSGFIVMRQMFSGYIFIDTEYPEEVLEQIDKTEKISALISIGSDGKRELLPMQRGEERFLNQVLTNGVLKVSYVEKHENNILIIGPLEKYRDRIEAIDYHNRRALVKIPMLREEKLVRFCLWLDKDPKLDWIEEEKKRRATRQCSP